MTDPTPVVEVREPSTQVIETIIGDSVIVDLTGSSGLGTGRAAPVAFRFEQTDPQTVWTIEHQLGYDPAGIVVVSTDGFVLDGFGVQYLVAGNSLRLSFDIAVSGVAYVS